MKKLLFVAILLPLFAEPAKTVSKENLWHVRANITHVQLIQQEARQLTSEVETIKGEECKLAAIALDACDVNWDSGAVTAKAGK